MKKTLVAVMVMVMGLSMAASALPEVTYDAEGCALTGDFAGWKYMTWITVLIMADVNELDDALYVDPEADPRVPTPLEEVDMEMLTGDGCPDLAQLYLMTSAICADTALEADFQVNADLAAGLVTALENLVAWGNSDGVADPTVNAEALETLGGSLIAFAASLVGGPYEAYAGDISDLGTAVYGFATVLLPEVAGMGQTVAALGTVSDVIAAEASLSSEFKATLEMLLGGLLEGLAAPVPAFGGMTPAQIADFLADGLTAVAAQLGALGQTELAAACTVGASTFTAGAAAIAAPVLPNFTVLGAKLAGEPFSAAGDYDGDGVTNGATYAAHIAAGGNAESFVAAASGADPFYAGNPLLPAAGIIGLAALVSAFAAGGAFVLRKK